VLLANAPAWCCHRRRREQLHPSLRGHPKIVSMEETDIRGFEGKRLPMRPDVVVIDVSFISLKAVLPCLSLRRRRCICWR